MSTGQPESLCTEHAIRVWSRRYGGLWTEADEVELRRWLASAAEHREAYDRVAALWATTGGLESRVKQFPHIIRATGPRRAVVACAAAIAVAVLVPLWRYTYHWWNGESVRWVAAPGEPRTIELPEGTRIVLDAGSELVVKLGARTRRAALVRGEALFSVQHDSSAPFEVEVGSGRVRDLGTRFDVEALRGATRIYVLEGRVGVATQRGEVVLTAGHSGGYDTSGALLPVQAADESIAQWPSGRRHFDNERLAAVVARLERYHGVTFVFANSDLEELRLSGTFHVTDLPLFLETLSTALPVEARWLGPGKIELADRATPPGETSPPPETAGDHSL